MSAGGSSIAAIAYGPRPGAEVTFPLRIVAEERGCNGDGMISVTARVPSEADRRAIAARGPDADYRTEAIRSLLVRVDGLRISDVEVTSAPEVIASAPNFLLDAIAGVLAHRLTLDDELAADLRAAAALILGGDHGARRDCRKCKADDLCAARACDVPSSNPAFYVTKLGRTFDRCPKRWLLDRPGVTALLSDVQRFRVRSAAPNGPAPLDQDAIFWEAVGVVESSDAAIQEATR